MSIGFALLTILAVAGAVAVIVLKQKREGRPTDDQLSEWEEFLIKGNRDQPKKKPLVTTSELSVTAYDAIEKLWNPKLRREFNERFLSLKNEISARAIQVEKVARRMGEGKALSEFDDAILIREKLRNGNTKDSPESDEPMDFTPGRKFDDEPKFSDQITN